MQCECFCKHRKQIFLQCFGNVFCYDVTHILNVVNTCLLLGSRHCYSNFQCLENNTYIGESQKPSGLSHDKWLLNKSIVSASIV